MTNERMIAGPDGKPCTTKDIGGGDRALNVYMAAEPIVLGTVGIDQVTDHANEVVVKSLLKGPQTTALNAVTVTTTSAEINCQGYNALMLAYISSDPTKLWNVEVQGSFLTGATKKSIFDNLGQQMILSNQTTNLIQIYKGCPDFIAIVGTSVSTPGAQTLTVLVQPFNMG